MKNKEYLKNVGNNIKIARLKQGITQELLAEKCNVSSKYISALERGITAGSISLIIDICNTLKVSPNYIFDKAINSKELNNNIDVIDKEILATYEKLKPENKDFINLTINHLYDMQKKR